MKRRPRKIITRVIVFLLLGAIVGFAIWSLRTPSISVRDVQQPETLVIRKRIFQGNIHSFSIHGSGKIDGAATITLVAEGKTVRVANLSGNVDFKWGGEWYYDTAEIRYEPADVRSGSLELRYKFN